MPVAFEQHHNTSRPDALALFTDRVEEQQMLRTILQPVPTCSLGAQHLLTQFYGVGGVGKSTLCERGRKIAEEEFKDDVRLVSTSFDDSRWNEGTSFTDVATELCRCLVEKGKIVPRLTIALLALHGQQTGRNGEVVSGLDKGWSLAFTAMEKGIDLTGIPGIGNVIKLAQWWRGKSQKNALREKLASFSLWPEEQNGRLIVSDLERKLAGALFQDIREWLNENPSVHLRVLLDGFERLQGSERKEDSQQRLQQWVGYFAAAADRDACDRFRIVIFGRNQLRWDELYEDAGWRDCWTLHLLGGLAETDARDFLHKARTWLVSNGQSAMADAILRNEGQILDACDETKGGLRVFHPFYLNLAVELVERARQQGKEPELGRAPGELQDRFFRYLQPHELRTLMILSLSEVFDEALFNWLARERLIDYPQHGFHSQLCREQPYFQPVEGSEGTWRFHRLMEDALHAKWHSTTELRREAVPLVERLLEYYGNPLKEKPERDWTDADAEMWRRGMEIIVTQGPERELLPAETWREFIGKKPWSLVSFRCLNHRLDFSRRVMRECERVLGPEHPDTLSSIGGLGRLLQDKCDYDGAEVLYRRAMKGREKVLGPEHPYTLITVSDIARVLYEKSDYTGAKALYRRAMEGKEKVLGPEHPDTLITVNDLALLLQDTGELDEARKLYSRALEGAEKTLGAGHESVLNIVSNIGTLFHVSGDYDEAEPLYRRAIAGQERTLGAEHLNTLTSVNNLGTLFHDRGDFAGAEPLFRRVLDGREKVLDAEHPDTLASVDNLATLFCNRGDYDEAEPLFRRAIAGQEKTLGAEHPNTLTRVNNLGVLLTHKGDFAGAEPLFRRALDGREKVLDAEHQDTLATVNCLGAMLRDKGDHTGAELLLRRALSAREATIGLEHPDTLTSVSSLARLLHAKGDYAGAEALYRRALEGREKVMRPDHPDTLASINYLGILLNEIKRRPEAVSLLRAYIIHSEKAKDGVRYNLARYVCLEGDIEEGKRLIAEHLRLHPEMKPQALKDPDFPGIHDYIETL